MRNHRYQIISRIVSFPTYAVGLIISLLINSKVATLFRLILCGYYNGLYSNRFKAFGKDSVIYRLKAYRNLEHVVIGNNTKIERGTLIRIFQDENKKYGCINIGNNVNIGLNVNISSCNSIEIQDGVLIGRNVMINDNSHGYTRNKQDLRLPPIERPIVSKGKIIIGRNVWLGENVVVLGNVTIGEGAVIGANSVVCKDIPPYSISGGVPAKIIKCHEEDI